jgi:hypothetical protein
MAQHILWRTESGGVLSAEVGSLRLVVKKTESAARFLLVRHRGDDQHPLLASGTEDDVRAAMEAGERMLGRLEPLLDPALNA